MKMLHKVEIAKFNKFADFLDRIPPNKFEMHKWGEYKFDGFKLGNLTLIPECGFAGCAVGWAIHAKLFEGLTWDELLSPTCHYPLYDDMHNFHALVALFGLGNPSYDEDHARFFFDPYYYRKGEIRDGSPSPKQVAARMRTYVKKIEGRIARHKAKLAVEGLISNIADLQPVKDKVNV